MKTSFYLVLWIVIYPILRLLNNNFIDNNSFVVAIVVVWILSWILNRVISKTLAYDNSTRVGPILEDVYTCNVASFKKRLSKDAAIETITAAYLAVTTLVIVLAIFNGGANDWIALIFFGFFTFAAISRSANLHKANSRLKADPTSEQCMEIAEETYYLDYPSYYERRTGVSYEEMLPPKPKHYLAYRIFSIVIAAISSLLGLFLIVFGLFIFFLGPSFGALFELGAVAGMFFLYGSLAAYYGVKDFISCIRPERKSASSEQNTK